MPSRRWLSVTVPVVCLTAFAIFLVLQFSEGDLDRGDKLASIVSMSITIVTLPLSVLAIVVTLRQGQPARAVLTRAERLDEMAEALAISVRSQWEAEEQVRRIHDPFPLPARWTNAPEHLTDHWQTIHGSPDPLDLDGHGDHIVDTFNRIPSGRLVVLGRAGAGKTILTSRFVLTLLASRPLPVPVIFSLGAWDPSAMSLRDWLTTQLITTYPVLTERDASGATAAALLLTTGRITPVLDGFDEINEAHRVDAINAINAGLRPGDRMLLTSRPEEYEAAVRSGDVLTAAAVVHLEDLAVADVATYLPLTTRKVHSGRNKWEPVLGPLRDAPDAPLARVLTTPLMVALARAIFSDTNADPAELLDIDSVTRLEERLLAGFVPAVYSGTGNGDASRWLGFLADHLHRLGTYDFAWWQLVLAVPRVVIGLTAGATLTLVALLMTGLPIWLSGLPDDDARGAWLLAWLGTGLLAGAIGGLEIGRLRGVRAPQDRMYLKVPRGLRTIVRWLVGGMSHHRNLLWLAVWTVAGLLFGRAAGVISGSPAGIPLGLGAGLLTGVVTLLIAISVRILGAWVDPKETVSPADLLRTDCITALREGLVFGIGMATMLWLVIWVIFERASGLPFAVVYGTGVWMLSWLVIAAGAGLVWMAFGRMWARG